MVLRALESTVRDQLRTIGDTILGGIEDEPEQAEWSLMEYTQRMNPRYEPSRVHYFLAEQLEAVFRRLLTRLIITFPPRHGKTTQASISFPAWCFGQDDSLNIIACSYAAALANTNSRKARNQIDNPYYPFPTRLAGDRASVQQWATTGGGEFNAAGVGGSITGMGADILLIDDYVKNMAEADSPERRERVWEWYTDVAYPRLQEDGVVVVIGTRWHEDDLIGRLLKAQPSQGGEGDEWTVIRLPALAVDDADEPDPLGREPGEPLWPERYDRQRLEMRKGVMSSRQWNAQYQASPVAEEGGMFKRFWWRFWHHQTMPLPPVTVKLGDGRTFDCPVVPRPHHFDEEAQSWDMSFGSLDDDASFVVGQHWGLVRGEAYLLSEYRNQVEFTGALIAVRAMNVAHPGTGRKWIENKANGPAVISALSKEIPGLIPIEPIGGKYARANAVTGFVESGNVFLPHPLIAPWVQHFIDEHAGFPAYATNDEVDACSQALSQFFLSERAGVVSSEAYAPVGVVSAQSAIDPDDPWKEAWE